MFRTPNLKALTLGTETCRTKNSSVGRLSLDSLSEGPSTSHVSLFSRIETHSLKSLPVLPDLTRGRRHTNLGPRDVWRAGTSAGP